jgi:outer membrane receptor for ferrienterochelin and colicin
MMLTASALAFASAVHAQDVGNDPVASEIVVLGSADRADEDVRNRREAFGVVDTLTQDDTGDLADETLAEALIRVPGVSSMQTLYGANRKPPMCRYAASPLTSISPRSMGWRCFRPPTTVTVFGESI